MMQKNGINGGKIIKIHLEDNIEELVFYLNRKYNLINFLTFYKLIPK